MYINVVHLTYRIFDMRDRGLNGGTGKWINVRRNLLNLPHIFWEYSAQSALYQAIMLHTLSEPPFHYNKD